MSASEALVVWQATEDYQHFEEVTVTKSFVNRFLKLKKVDYSNCPGLRSRSQPRSFLVQLH